MGWLLAVFLGIACFAVSNTLGWIFLIGAVLFVVFTPQTPPPKGTTGAGDPGLDRIKKIRFSYTDYRDYPKGPVKEVRDHTVDLDAPYISMTPQGTVSYTFSVENRLFSQNGVHIDEQTVRFLDENGRLLPRYAFHISPMDFGENYQGGDISVSSQILPEQ